jgi:hypothetical protein
MSVIGRYKKKGGFLQLLELIETSGVSKQEKFLSLIEAESPAWAKTIREKMLTVDKILNSSDEVIKELFSDLRDLTLATASFGFGEERTEKIMKNLSHTKQRKVKEQIAIVKPNEGEITTAYIQIFAEIRKLAANNRNLLAMIDPNLAISETLENELLGTNDVASGGPTGNTVADLGEARPTGNADTDEEIFRLRRIIKSTQDELDKVKAQNLDLRLKLEKIQKLVS